MKAETRTRINTINRFNRTHSYSIYIFISLKTLGSLRLSRRDSTKKFYMSLKNPNIYTHRYIWTISFRILGYLLGFLIKSRINVISFVYFLIVNQIWLNN